MIARAPLKPDDPRHGTRNGYNYWQCRCRACTAANARLTGRRLTDYLARRHVNCIGWEAVKPCPIYGDWHGCKHSDGHPNSHICKCGAVAA